jgi:TolB protein
VHACRWGADHEPFLANATFEICVIDIATGDVQRLTTNPVADLTPTWSPDGGQMLFHRNVPIKLSDGSTIQTQQLFVMNANGTNQRQLTFIGDRWNNLAN